MFLCLRIYFLNDNKHAHATAWRITEHISSISWWLLHHLNYERQHWQSTAEIAETYNYMKHWMRNHRLWKRKGTTRTKAKETWKVTRAEEMWTSDTTELSRQRGLYWEPNLRKTKHREFREDMFPIPSLRIFLFSSVFSPFCCKRCSAFLIHFRSLVCLSWECFRQSNCVIACLCPLRGNTVPFLLFHCICTGFALFCDLKLFFLLWYDCCIGWGFLQLKLNRDNDAFARKLDLKYNQSPILIRGDIVLSLTYEDTVLTLL